MSARYSRRAIVVPIAVGVAAIHFVVGPNYGGPWPIFVGGYLIDIALPFAMYLVLGVTNVDTLQSPVKRAILVFGTGAIVETLQYFGVPIFGRTFDPIDYMMYGLGVGLGVLFERTIFPTRATD